MLMGALLIIQYTLVVNETTQKSLWKGVDDFEGRVIHIWSKPREGGGGTHTRDMLVVNMY